jgi:hypothetical protein
VWTMSIVAMMADAAAARSRVQPRRRRAAGDDLHGVPAAVAAELVRYVPTEAVALYTAILPFLVPEDAPLSSQDYTSRWYLAAGVAVAAVLFAVGVYRREVIARGGVFHWPVRRTTTVVAAYAAWVFAIPGSPLNSFTWYSPPLGAIAGLVTGAAISLFHLWFGDPEH